MQNLCCDYFCATTLRSIAGTLKTDSVVWTTPLVKDEDKRKKFELLVCCLDLHGNIAAGTSTGA